MPASHDPPIPYEQVTRCLKYIHDWREHLAHAWVGRVSGTPDVRVIGDAVDDLISLALLVEKARRTSPASVPMLRDVIASSGGRKRSGPMDRCRPNRFVSHSGGRLPDNRCREASARS